MTRSASLNDAAPPGESAPAPGSLPRLRQAVADRFFPVDQGKDPFWVLALITVVAGALAATRLGWAGLNTIWGEDGTVFYQGAIDHPLRSFVETYNGYLVTTSRIIAGGLAPFPLSWLAVANALADALALGLLAALAYRACGTHIRTPWLRLIPVAVVAICPIGDETWDSVANLMWPMYFVVFLVLLWNPRRPAAIAVGTVTAVLLTLTSPFGLLLAPVAVARIVALGRTRGSVVPAATLAGIVVQGTAMVLNHGRQSYTTVLPGKIAHGYAFNVAGRGFFGEQEPVHVLGLRLSFDYQTLGIAVVAALVIALVATGLAGKGRQCALGALALVYSLGYFAVVTVISGIFIGKSGGDRYFVGPFLLLTFIVAILLDAAVVGLRSDGTAPWAARWDRAPHQGAARARRAWVRAAGYVPRVSAAVLCAALTACLVFSVTLDWNKPQPHRQHPTWPAALAGARAWCAHQPDTATVRIRIDAAHPTIPWYVRLTCAKVR